MQSNFDGYHPTAIIDPKAKIGRGTRVGPYSIIGPDVVLGENCEIQEHVVIRGITEIGNEVKVFPFACLGGEPQHLAYKGEPTKTLIGDRCTIREGVTIHRGIPTGIGVTQVGEDSFIMAYAHIAHDCNVGKRNIIVNSVQLAGHVTLEDFVTIGGASEVAQHCRVGKYCYVAGGSTLRKDLPPYLTGKGNEFQVQGINAIGMERLGISDERIKRIKSLYKLFYLKPGTVAQAIERAQMELGDHDDIKEFIQFIKTSKVGLIR